MCVYKKENPSFLHCAMNSMWFQTVPTDDFVLVCDGPLTPELDKTIEEMKQLHPDELNVIRLDENHGLGYALQVGLNHCKNELIARMDSDDISFFERCERELNIFANIPDISIVGSVISEFMDNGSSVPVSFRSKRVVPERQKDIIEFAKKRNPFNHPSVMFRKKDVLAVGSYPDVRYMQDYYLWTYMLIQGFKGYNIQEPLVFMRANDDLFKRRSGKLYRDTQTNLIRYMRAHNFISGRQFYFSYILRSASSMAPNWLRQFIFKLILRKK